MSLVQLYKNPIPITQQTWPEQIKPLVSISCITYNHENYIRDAIEGFLIQKTTFPVEILIHDDASTDKTAQIVKEYAENHSDLIITIFQTENQYSQGIKPWPNFVFPRARGKYIALCEGDDYWTDPFKLQKQVDFLEENPEYSLCVGGFVQYDTKTALSKNIIIEKNNNDFEYGYTFSIEESLKQWITKTLTLCFRKCNIEDLQPQKFKYLRDVVLIYHLLTKGKGFYFSQIFGVYNMHQFGIHSGSTNLKRLIDAKNVYCEMFKYYKTEHLKTICFQHRYSYLLSYIPEKGILEYYLKLYDSAIRLLRLINRIDSFLRYVYLFIPFVHVYRAIKIRKSKIIS